MSPHLASTSTRPRRPLLSRLRVLRLEPGPLVAHARRRTRLEDLADDEVFRTALDLLLRSYETEARLSLVGRIAAWQDTIRLLANRLRLVEDRKRRPEIAGQEVRGPVFLTGLPRTGTTLLHGLLAQDPASRVPLHWETVFPSPPPERGSYAADPRIDAAERQLRWFHRLQPGIMRIHPVGARLPQECLIITSHSFLSLQFQTTHHVPSYQAWLEAQDLRPGYEWHRRFLQHLQSRCAGERWVLKAPAHLFGLPALFATYPDAKVIFTHRDPVEVSTSLASLTAALRSTFSEAVDPVAIAREMTARWANAIERACHFRDRGQVAAERFFDVRYTDLLSDPMGTVRRLYAHFDLPLTGVTEERMRGFLVANPKDKHGRHQHSATRCGLDPGREHERYRWYRDRFGV